MTFIVNLADAVQGAAHYEPATLTLAELARAFDAAHPTGNSQARLRKWLAAIGTHDAWAINAEQLTAAAEAMHRAGYAPASINRDLSALGSLFKWARRKRFTPRGFVSPTVGIARYAEAVRHVEVSDAELAALKARAKLGGNAQFHLFVCLLIDTGARKSELLERFGRDFEIDRRRILLKTSKTGKPRYLYFSEATAALIPPLAPDRLVFQGRAHGVPIDFRKRWAAATADIGRPDLHMHDIRHACAASLLRAGVTIGVAAQVLGHSSLILQRRYGHLESATLQQAQALRW